MPQDIKKALQNIGLNDKQSSVLLILLERGPTLVSTIAKLSHFNRTTLYGILKELAEKGLVSSTDKGTLRYQSIAPELLPSYIERHRETLTESKEAVEKALPQLKLLRSKGSILPRVQLFEGRQGVEQAREDTLENNAGKRLYEITGIEAVYTKLDPKFVQYYVDKRTRLGIKSTYITPKTAAAIEAKKDDEKYLREAKFIPPEFNFDTEISIYDNKVGIFSYALESPVALIIEDAAIAKTLKKLFEYIETTIR